MEKLGDRWTFQPGGQYIDGNERIDVIHYCQHVFLPAMTENEARLQNYNNDDNEEDKPWPHDIEDGPWQFQDLTILWDHDESIFHANDR